MFDNKKISKISLILRTIDSQNIETFIKKWMESGSSFINIHQFA